MEDDITVMAEPSGDFENASESTPLLRESRGRMPEKNIGISQQTLVSNAGENGNRPRKLPQYIAGLSSTLGALAAGMVLAWSSAAGNEGVRLDYGFPISSSDFSWISSAVNLGAATICVPIGILCDIIGRKTSMLALTVPFTIGWACVLWPNSVGTLIVGRYILGISGGAFCVTAPMYTAEIADNETRGRLGSYFQLLLTVGILSTYLLGSFDSISMFTLSIISAAIPLIFCAVFFFMPETPAFHLMRGDVEMARKTLEKLRGPNYNVELELDEQRESLEQAKREKTSFLVLVKKRAAIKGFIIAFGLMFFQQLSGVNAIIFYAGGIFEDALHDKAKWPTILLGALQVGSVFVSSLIVDKFGRRPLLLVSCSAMCLSTLIFGGYFYYTDYVLSGKEADSSLTWLPILCICSFIVLFSLGFGPIPWMMMGEIFSSQIKGVAGSSACLFNWLMAFVVTRFYSDMKAAAESYGTFWIFSAICGIGVVFVFFIVPETKGKTLDQIQIELGGGSSPHPRNQATTNKT